MLGSRAGRGGVGLTSRVVLHVTRGPVLSARARLTYLLHGWSARQCSCPPPQLRPGGVELGLHPLGARLLVAHQPAEGEAVAALGGSGRTQLAQQSAGDDGVLVLTEQAWTALTCLTSRFACQAAPGGELRCVAQPLCGLAHLVQVLVPLGSRRPCICVAQRPVSPLDRLRHGRREQDAGGGTVAAGVSGGSSSSASFASSSAR